MNATTSARTRALMPHEYEMIWRLIVNGPQTAAELAAARGSRYEEWTARKVAPQLRSLVRRGWVARAGTGHYSATERAFASVSW